MMEKDWEEHTTCCTMHCPVMSFVRPSLATKVAAQLPGVGGKRAMEVARYFGSVKRMVEGGEREWRKALGVKGKESKVVGRIVRAMEGKGE